MSPGSLQPLLHILKVLRLCNCIAKNIVLAGVKSVTIFDPELVRVQDLGTQVGLIYLLLHLLIAIKFFLRENDIGRPRGEATAPRLAELNTYVPVKHLPGVPGQEISVDLVKGFQVRLVDFVPTWLLYILCRSLSSRTYPSPNNLRSTIGHIRMIFPSFLLTLVGCLGESFHDTPLANDPSFYRTVFNDFGPKFTCVDPKGEQPLTGMIVSVAEVCLFHLLEAQWFSFDTG